MRVLPHETWETAPPLDVLVYPGGRGARKELADEAVLDWILHLVARLHSPERAREVRRYIQYDPEPPV